MIRRPSGDQTAPQIALISSVSRILPPRPSWGSITQVSLSPSRPLLVAKEIREPSGETDQAMALSRSLWGATPCSGTIQILLVCDDQEPRSSLAGCALARNSALPGNQAAERISQSTLLPLSASGRGTARSSPD